MVQPNKEKVNQSHELLEQLKEQRGGSLVDFHKVMANDPLILQAFMKQYEILNKTECNIPRKYRELMIMAVGAARGLDTTVKTHAKIAVEQGATVDEISEAFRIVYLLCGVSGVFQLANVFDPLPEKE